MDGISTLQIGEPSFLAERLGVPIVSDFRTRDMAAGGQGAPLIPILDEFLFGDGPPRALQNIGGIGNVALVGQGVKSLGFDTGPEQLLAGPSGNAHYSRRKNFRRRRPDGCARQIESGKDNIPFEPSLLSAAAS